MGFTIVTESFDLFEIIVESIFVICLSKFENKEFTNRYNWFMEKFKTFDNSYNESIDKILLSSEYDDKKSLIDDADGNNND